ncbi:MAG: aspartate aminotransferase family protein [Clostridia bacterium]
MTYMERRNKYLMAQARHQLYDEPIVLDRGNMELLYDVDGKEYIDCFSGIMVVSFGHCNQEINETIHKQVDKLQHISTFFLSEPMLDLAEKLAEITPEGLQRSFFVNSGSEAVDSAILLARAHTGNEVVIPVRYGYHGRTLLGAVCTNVAPSLAIDARAPQLDIDFANNGYCYRCPVNKECATCNVECKLDVENVIARNGNKIAGILVEPIQGVGGVITPPEKWLKRMEELAHQAGGLLIVDEVQCGFGRTGKVFFSNGLSYKPDIMTMAKGIANGIAAGAYIATDEVGEAIKFPTFATFGGSPLAAATALATISYMEKYDIPARANEAGERFKAGLRKIQKEYGLIGDIRGEGMFIGAELVRDIHSKEPATEETLKIMNICRNNGLIVGKSGPKTNVIRLGAPLTIRDRYIDQAIDILADAFAQVSKK